MGRSVATVPADPSSIDSCMVGGMVSNNSSGMCCGVSQNTYHTLKDMRVVFADGTLLDTADPASREAFLQASAAACNQHLSCCALICMPNHCVMGNPCISCMSCSSPGCSLPPCTQLCSSLCDPLCFCRVTRNLVTGVQDLAKRVQCDRELTALIRRKFAIKCTTGDLVQPSILLC